jgi:DNA-binding response OmpR family regulator
VVPNVLVVDDDDVIRDVVVRYLERDGFATEQVADGASARGAIERRAPDLVVLDVMLPNIDGLELCRWIRSQGDVPVILLTARGEEADRILGLELGADDYVVKPFSPRELSVRVAAVLRRTRRAEGEGDGAAALGAPPGVGAAGSTFLDVGGLHIDLATREVARQGKGVPLTATEFDLLWCLASHPRVVFSRAQLLAHVWGYRSALDAGTSTVTVHVRRLREKVEEDPSAPRLIETVWGVGYRLTP